MPDLLGRMFPDGLLFQSMLQASQDYIALLDVDGGVQFVNAVGQELMPTSDGAGAIGRPWSEIWPDDYAEDLRRVLAAGARGEVSRFRAWRTSGAEPPKWWDAIISPVFDADPQKVQGLLAVCRDVTTQMQTQSFLDAILDSVPTVLFVKNASDGRYLLLNQEAEDVFGHSRADILGKTDHELGLEWADIVQQADADVVRSGKIRVIEDTRGSDPENRRAFRTKLLATYGEEGPCHIIGMMEDVTEQKAIQQALSDAAEKADSANRAKSEFLANMSHEIRTPLNGVVGVAGVLAETSLSDKQLEMVEIIRSSAQTLERLLSDVLDLARVESGLLEIQNEPFHLANAVRTVTALAEARVHEKGLTIPVQIAPEAEAWVLGDIVRVKQIVTNFVSNAVKFTERGEVRVVVSCESEADGRRVFRFEVRDTGVGFDPSKKDVVFGRFQQADGSITRRFGGTGLGLAISKQLANMMDGDVDCDSTPGEGSVFTLVMPLELTDPPKEEIVEAVDVDGPQPEALRILLADDHATNRRVCELILSQIDAELVSVEDGSRALEAFKTDRFDVVLMDMQMPVMDGLAATRAIRAWEREQGLDRTLVFMLTANALAEHVEASRAAGADRHVTKPVTSAGLLTALAQSLAGQAAGQEASAGSVSV